MSSVASSGRKIPIVDLGQISLAHEGEASQEGWKIVARLLCDAFTDIGFAYLTNHGFPDDQVNRLFESGAAFFRLDQATKERYSTDANKKHGYIAVDQEILDRERNAHELREAYNVVTEDGTFPDAEVECFRPAVVDFLKTCRDLTTRILTALALGLGSEENFFVSAHQNLSGYDNMSCLRLLHYPPVPTDVPKNSTRCGIHTDYGTITLLFQDALGGLQVRDRQGMWVEADPLPGTILVNVGDLLQFWTADKFKATEHRVLIPEDELRLRSPRRSVAFFVHPDDAVLITPLDGSSTYQPITAKEHVLKRFSATYNY